MQIPDLPEEDPLLKADELSKPDDQLKRIAKPAVFRGFSDHHPAENAEKSASIPERRPAPLLTIGNFAQAARDTKSEYTLGASAESHPQNKNLPVRPGREPDQGSRLHSDKNNNPGRRLHAFEVAAKKAPRAKIPREFRLRPNRELTHRAYWDVTTSFSLIVNAVLIALVFIMAGQIRNLKTTVNSLFDGLYGNFVRMDQASINTTIMVDTQIPLNFNLPVSETTEVVLTRDVGIPGAHVVINTGILNINTQANITLPAGTSLPITLNMDIPVQSTIPISLQVPVNIPVSQTELHGPITELQTSLRPLYCMLNKNAQFPEGIYICADHDVPSSNTP